MFRKKINKQTQNILSKNKIYNILTKAPVKILLRILTGKKHSTIKLQRLRKHEY